MDMGIKGKVALVTGGSRSIGRATSLLLGAEGARVAVNYVKNKGAADEVVKMIADGGSAAVAVRGDVSVKADVERVIAETEKALGPINILVNNAGIAAGGWSLDKLEEEGWDKVMDVDLKSVWLVSQPVAAKMAARGGGAIVNVASFMGYPMANTAAYGTAKAGVIHLTKTMAMELAKKNVRVNSVSPGNIATDMTAHMFGTEEKREKMKERIPLGRIAVPEDVADLIVFLAGDRAKHVTGVDVNISGGQLIY